MDKKTNQSVSTQAQSVPIKKPEGLDIPAVSKHKEKKLYIKVFALNIVNAILIVLISVFLSRLSVKAEEVKELRHKVLLSQESSEISFSKAEIERNRERISKIESLFANEQKILDLYAEMDVLKNEGVVTDFRLLNDKPVTDLGAKALPIFIGFRGGAERVNSAINKIYSMPYLIRPVRFELTKNTESGEIEVSYGAMLYVSE